MHHIVIADNTAKMNASLFDRFRVQGSRRACIFLCACGTRASVDAHTHTHTHTHTHSYGELVQPGDIVRLTGGYCSIYQQV